MKLRTQLTRTFGTEKTALKEQFIVIIAINTKPDTSP
jgi:hypothetical protein